MFEFLEKMKTYCEIIIFTAATKDYADVILDSLELVEPFFDYRLYRQHTSFHGISIIKDLSWIGRNLNKTIIIDNISDNFKLQYSNGLAIKTWCGDIKDEELYALKVLLSSIFETGSSDILPFIKTLKDSYKAYSTYTNIEVKDVIK